MVEGIEGRAQRVVGVDPAGGTLCLAPSDCVTVLAIFREPLVRVSHCIFLLKWLAFFESSIKLKVEKLLMIRVINWWSLILWTIKRS